MQITTGIRAILSRPSIYDLSQTIMGAANLRRELAASLVTAGKPVRILDIGCGTGAILDYFPSNVEYFGFDISQIYIESAKKKYRGRGMFFCEMLDETRVNNLPKFDVVLAIGVLHHLEDTDARKVMKLAEMSINAAGRFVSIDPCFAQGQNPIARFLISRDRGQNVRTDEGYQSLAMGIFSTVRGDLRHRSWIPYTHWFMECSR